MTMPLGGYYFYFLGGEWSFQLLPRIPWVGNLTGVYCFMLMKHILKKYPKIQNPNISKLDLAKGLKGNFAIVTPFIIAMLTLLNQLITWVVVSNIFCFPPYLGKIPIFD